MSAGAAAAWPIVLVGLPGAGKSTVGRRLAARLAVPFLDLDEEVERRAGVRVAEIFAARGEAAFRALERALTGELPGRRAVVAPGGGWMSDPANAATLRPGALIVHLRVAPATALARMGAERDERPLLAGNAPLEILEALARRRADAYAGADAAVDTEGLDVEGVVVRLLALVGRPR